MPSLKDIRRRIGSVKNTQKITRAMKLVSAAKFARANAAVVAARPYGQAFDAMVQKLIAMAGEDFENPLLQQRPEQRVLLVVQATDRGFCGGLNSNLFKFVNQFLVKKKAAGVQVDLVPWGKRARIYADKQTLQSQSAREKVLDKPNYAQAKVLADELIEKFTTGGYDRVYLAFVEFQSAMTQNAKVMQLLPLGLNGANAKVFTPDELNIIVEPSLKVVLDGLLRRAAASLIFRTMLEGAASEHGARMTAMDSATNNAQEVLRKIKIQYNRARQAAITKELIEIISGAQAL